MGPTNLRPDPPDGEAVWHVGAGESAAVKPRYLCALLEMLLPLGLTAALGTISFSDAEGRAIASFWPAAALQVVFSIWFGVYGAIAGMVGPMLGNALVGVSESYLRDPTAQSAMGFGALAGLYGRWAVGNIVPCVVLVPLMLKTASPMLVRAPFFCQRFCAGVDPMPGCGFRWSRFDDVPITVKLGAFLMLTGMRPLYVVAGWLVWDRIGMAEHVIANTNVGMVEKIRDGNDRHETMLAAWAEKLDQPGVTLERQRALLEGWRQEKHAFADLRIADRDAVLAEMTGLTPAMVDRVRVAFGADKGTTPEHVRIRGLASLRSEPGKVLTGIAEWRRGAGDHISLEKALRGLIVLDREGRTLFRSLPPGLDSWRPTVADLPGEAATFEHDEHRWHIASASIDRLGWHFATLTSAKSGRSAVLSQIPGSVAIFVNLAIFGVFIAGSTMAHGLGRRVLDIAEHVHASGGKPGALNIPVRGRDELGYLGETLNHMSRDLEVHIRELRETTAEKERLAHEMELARRVQQDVLPAEPPVVRGYEFAAVCLPAYEVGGDFYDLFVRPDGCVGAMIGDATGKGLAAAICISETRGIARAAALTGLTPDGVLGATNHAVASENANPERFVTMFCGLLDPGTHRFDYASAGHNPPVLLRNSHVEELKLGGMPLAVDESEAYRLDAISLAPGDSIVMYTDGVTEAVDPDGRFYEERRLADILIATRARSAQELLDAVLGDVGRFAGASPQSDDLTVLVLRRVEEI